MTITDPKSGGWVANEKLTSPQMNLVRAGLLKALDGVDGGTYSLSTDLIFGGAGDVQIDNVLRILTGASLIVDVGGGAIFDGAAAFNEDVQFFEEVFFRTGGTTEFRGGNAVSFFDLDDLGVNADSHTYRIPLVPLGIALDGSVLPFWETGTAAGGPEHGRWVFDYDQTAEDDDEAGYRFGAHPFRPGEYVSIRDENGEMHTFKVISVEPAT